MLAVALAFGLVGVVANRLLPDRQPLRGSVADVQVAQVWETVLPDTDGVRQPFAQWQGKVLVVNFWAPWCPPCRQEMPGFIRLQDKLATQGVQFVGVALDEAAPVRAFMREIAVNYPVLLGGMGAVLLGQAAGNRLGGLPYTLILDRQGNPVTTLSGAIDESRLEGILRPLL